MEFLLLPHPRHNSGWLIVAFKEEKFTPADKNKCRTGLANQNSQYSLALFRSTFAFVGTIKEFSIEQLHRNDSKYKLKKRVHEKWRLGLMLDAVLGLTWKRM